MASYNQLWRGFGIGVMIIIIEIMCVLPVSAWTSNTLNNSVQAENISFSSGNLNITRLFYIPSGTSFITKGNIYLTIPNGTSNVTNPWLMVGGYNIWNYTGVFGGPSLNQTNGVILDTTSHSTIKTGFNITNYARPQNILSITKNSTVNATRGYLYNQSLTRQAICDFVGDICTFTNNNSMANATNYYILVDRDGLDYTYVYSSSTAWFPVLGTLIRWNKGYGGGEDTHAHSITNISVGYSLASAVSVDVKNVLNNYLNNNCSGAGNCNVSFVFHSDYNGSLQYYNINISNEGFIENSQTYNSSVYETSNQVFIINFSYDSSNYFNIGGTLIYNNTNYAGILSGTGSNILFNASTDIPLGNYDTKTFLWQIQMANGTGIYYYNSTSYTQVIAPILLYSCTTTSNQTLNFTAQNEENMTGMVNWNFLGTFNYWLGEGTIKKNVSINNLNINYTSLCISPNNSVFYINAIIQYEKEDYVKRNYYFYNASLTNITNNVILYFLDNVVAKAFIISVKDSSQLPITDAYVYIQRYYPGTDTYQTVAMAKTDGSGNTIGYFEVETEDYKIIVMKDGVIIYTSPVQKVYCSATPCTLPIQTSGGGVAGWSHVGNLSNLIYYGPSYNSTTGLISYTYIDTSGTTHYGRLWVYKVNSATGKQTICNTNSSSNAATLTCNVTGYEGTIYAESYISRSPEVLVWAVSFIIETLKSIMSMQGLFWAMLIILTLAVGGAVMGGVTGGIVGTIMGFIGATWLGIASFGMITIWGLIIIGVFIIWQIKN